MNHNLHNSPLCRLPEELILEIMEYLDAASIFCLRRASHIFFRLFGSHSFKHMHDSGGFFGVNPRTAQRLPRNEAWHSVSSLLRRDAYCGDCNAGHSHALGHEVNYMHCSACDTDHPVTLFSLAQRRAGRSSRVCIGLEGQVRLCQHKTVKTKDILRRSGVVPRVSCHHPSHVPEHHRRLRLGRAPVYPTLDIGVDTKKGQAVLYHTAHMDLALHGQDVLAAEDFRERIRELREGPAGFIVPEYAPGIVPELRCFDPSRCGCLLYPGLAPHEGECEPHEVTRKLFSRVTDGDNVISIRFETCEHGPRCLKVTHSRTIHFRTRIGPVELELGLGPERVRGARCDRHWQLDRALDAVSSRVSYNLVSALDPDSFDITHDRESYGVTWCDSAGCANNRRYLRERAVRGQRLNAACAHGCEQKKVRRRARRRSAVPTPGKDEGAFVLTKPALWVDMEWRPGRAPQPAITHPPQCVIL